MVIMVFECVSSVKVSLVDMERNVGNLCLHISIWVLCSSSYYISAIWAQEMLFPLIALPMASKEFSLTSFLAESAEYYISLYKLYLYLCQK